MTIIRAYNIKYDTFSEGKDHRPELGKKDIPDEVFFEVDNDEWIERDPDYDDDLVLKEIERDWLVDRFDWEVVGAPEDRARHCECQVRENYGESIFDTWAFNLGLKSHRTLH